MACFACSEWSAGVSKLAGCVGATASKGIRHKANSFPTPSLRRLESISECMDTNWPLNWLEALHALIWNQSDLPPASLLRRSQSRNTSN
eukprot:gene3818-biopygen12242